MSGRTAAPVPGQAPAGAADPWGASEISVSYGGTPALDRASLRVLAGQVTAVVGGDGAGKTTLLRCLAGALAPDSGQVRAPAAARIGYLPAGSGIYPDLTVGENLAFRAAAYGLERRDAREREAELLERAGLAGVRERLGGQLSGGMRQKLGVIAALLHRPELLVLDEPTTGVDPVSRSGLWRLIARAAAAGAAVVAATSYLDEAQRAAFVLVLDGGRQLAAGTPEQIVAALPGQVRALAQRPEGAQARRAWRRAGRWRVWDPPAEAAERQPDGELVSPDLQDAVTAAALARELLAAGDAAGAVQVPPREIPPREIPPREEPARQVPPRRGGPLASCAGVSRRFGEFTAVREVDLRVQAGEIVGLLGANGAGKTTLIRLLLGLLEPSAGQVSVFGQAPSRQTRRGIGYLPQGLGLYADLTAAENLRFTAAVFGARPPELSGQLRPFAGTLVEALPLGVQRRVAFAAALCHQPGLLVLDEPTSGVDPLGRARLWQTIQAAADDGAGVLVTTHYMEEAEECTRLVIMAEGAVVAAGTAAGIVGGARVTVVEAESWVTAFGRLEAAGLPVTLAGRALRVPTGDEAAVRRALGDAKAHVLAAPATLEERFFQLTLPEAAGRQTPR